MTSDAEVCRMKRKSAPSLAPTSASRRRASLVISMKSRPRVCTMKVAVAISSGTTLVIVDKDPLTLLSWRLRSGPSQDILLQRDNHLDHPAPHLFNEVPHFIKVSVL